jgi:hypothetical protein
VSPATSRHQGHASGPRAWRHGPTALGPVRRVEPQRSSSPA